MEYQVIWNGEIIGYTDCEQAALNMLKECREAFMSDDIYIRVVATK